MAHPPFPSASLYVGNLASDVSEGHLFEIFNMIGPVSLIRVCRDAITRRRSLGYAYVNYHNVVDAERALELLNNSPVKGRPCRIMWSQRDPSLRKSGIGNLFVKNLDKSIGHKELYEIFSVYGNILSCKVALDPLNVSKTYGFVHFESPEDAEKAILQATGRIIKDKPIGVSHFLPRKERQLVVDQFTNLFVKNLEESVDNEKLRELFQPFGQITSSTVMYTDNCPSKQDIDPARPTELKKKSKGFGFVNFVEHSQAVAAIQALNQKTLSEAGKPLYVGKAQKKSIRAAQLRQKFERFSRKTDSQGVNLYIKNLDDEVDENVLKNDFQAFGTVLKTKVMRDDKGKSRGYGFVSFKSREEAFRAIYEFQQKNLQGQPIHVALAHKKDNSNRADRPRGSRWNDAPSQNSGRNVSNVGVRLGEKRQVGGRQNFQRRHNNNNNNKARNQQNKPKAGMRKSQATPSPPPPSQPTEQQNEQGLPQETLAPVPAQPTPSDDLKEHETKKDQQQQQQQQQQPDLSVQQPERTNFLFEEEEEEGASIDSVAEQLYPLIAELQPELASKITGMLIESYPQPADLSAFISDPQALKVQVAEAVAILSAH